MSGDVTEVEAVLERARGKRGARLLRDVLAGRQLDRDLAQTLRLLLEG